MEKTTEDLVNELLSLDDQISILESKKKEIRFALAKAMQTSHVQQLRFNCASVTLAAGKRTVRAGNLDKVSSLYVKRVLDSNAVLKAIDAGMSVAGVTVTTGDPYIVVQRSKTDDGLL